MKIRRIAAVMVLLLAGLAAPSGAAERSNVVREALTIESHQLVGNKVTKTVESLPQTVDVAVYRPDDGLKHPAIVYLHGGGMSFADPLMEQFHIELARRGLVVLAPHYLLDGTGWQQWQESATKAVTLAASLPSVDPERIGMSGLSMGGQIGLSTAARDPRVKAVAEFFTAWPGTLPDEPIDKLPPALLLNGTADPIIPFATAMALDGILEEHKLPFERHAYEGLGHGFGTPEAFADGVNRTAAFFGGRADGHGSTPAEFEAAFDLGADDGSAARWAATMNRSATFTPKKKRKRPVVKPPAKAGAVAAPPKAGKP